MSTKISYLIDGKSCSGLEYLKLIEDIFNRESIDTSYIELQNGEGISLGGCKACVSILHQRNDGTTWSPSEEITKEFVTSLTKAFIESDTAKLSLYGATLLPKERKKVDISEGGKINRVLSKLFLYFLSIGVIVSIVCGMSDVPSILWALAFLFFSLALLIIMVAGLFYMVDTYRYVSKSITTTSRFKNAGAWFLLTCGLLFMFVFSVALPLYLIAFMGFKVSKML